MQIIIGVFVALLQGYLALTSQLAVHIEQAFAVFTTTPPPTESSEAAFSTPLTPLTSEYTGAGRIPDILLRSSDYQQASLIAGQAPFGATTDNPLEALVNIYCTLETEDTIRTTTGTGVIISPAGIILTNAHVAQFLLLKNTNLFNRVECIIRTGNPATASYRAELLYLPPAWIQRHATLINDAAPSGTGERDYALLYITSGLQNQPLPLVFPALAVDTRLLNRSAAGAVVEAAGYPARVLREEGRNGLLRPEIATTTISELYTFGSNYADVFSIRGSNVGAQGSSGGPVIAADGRVIGLITTRGDDARDGPGSLRAITLSHIDRTIQSETGFSLERNLQGDLPFRAAVFNRTLAPFLQRLLELGF